MPLLLEIITPEAKACSQEVDTIALPTVTGEIGILPGHIPLITLLAPGEATITRKGKQTYWAIDKGFAHVSNDTVTLLTEAAAPADAIDLSAVTEAQTRAEKALELARRHDKDPVEIEQLETIIRFAIVQKLAKRRRRN